MMDKRYDHRFHAGNVGDIWKHTALCSILAALDHRKAIKFIDTHAGEGRYPLGPTGEWTEGIGKLWQSNPEGSVALTRYLNLVPAPSGTERSYLGSPQLALAILRPDDQIVAYEIDPDACKRLAYHLQDSRVTARRQDGLGSLSEEVLATASSTQLLVFVDPSYGAKEEWMQVPDALAAVWHQRPEMCVLLWYPIKSYTRPNAMFQRLVAAGVPAVVLELITTPLEIQKNRLNGSGVLLVNPPRGCVNELAAAAPVIGTACATHDGRWSTRGLAWSAR